MRIYSKQVRMQKRTLREYGAAEELSYLGICFKEQKRKDDYYPKFG